MMKYLSPNGNVIVGTAETVLATALISDIDPDTGQPIHEGGTEVHWDTQETRERNGQILFVCDEGDEWTFDQLNQYSPTEQDDAAELPPVLNPNDRSFPRHLAVLPAVVLMAWIKGSGE
jgi:hypothetical protein